MLFIETTPHQTLMQRSTTCCCCWSCSIIQQSIINYSQL